MKGLETQRIFCSTDHFFIQKRGRNPRMFYIFSIPIFKNKNKTFFDNIVVGSYYSSIKDFDKYYSGCPIEANSVVVDSPFISI